MNIETPSATIIEDSMAKLSLPERIERCGRICYKSEEKITKSSAEPFCRKVIELKHNSVLEMATVTLYIIVADKRHVIDFMSFMTVVDEMRFLKISLFDDGSLLITGSIRTFKALAENKQCSGLMIARRCFQKIGFLDKEYSSVDDYSNEECQFWKVDDHWWEMIRMNQQEAYRKHKHVAVKFIVNRAVSHEIVRHRPCSFLQESQRYCRYSEDKFGSEVSFIKPMFFAEDSSEYALWEKAMLETEQLYLKLLKTSTPQAARTVLPNSCKTEIIVYANLDEWRHIFSQRDTAAAEPSMREVMAPLHDDFKQKFPEFFGQQKGEK